MQISSALIAVNPDQRLHAASVGDVFDSNSLCTMATLSGDGSPHVNTAYYAVDEWLNLYILTPPSTRHSKNVLKTPQVALTVFDSHQLWDGAHVGLQIFGTCAKVDDDDESAFATYSARHVGLLSLADSSGKLKTDLKSRLYRVEISSLHLVDERRYGLETSFTINVARL